MPFRWTSVALVLLFLALTLTAARLTRRWSSLWCRLPRLRLPGVLLGTLCLAWAAAEVNLMLEGDMAVYHRLVWAAVPVVALLAYIHLDFLFARALGGLLLLLLTDMLHQAFAIHLPARLLFAAAAYLVCLWAMALVAAPWYFRDLLQQTAESRPWRHGTTAVFAALSLVFAAYGALSWPLR